MARIQFIIGGVRSGKSRFAQQLAERIGGDNVTFIATALAGDEEMKQRIAAHQRQRPVAWKTCEAPLKLTEALRQNATAACTIIDCLTLFVSNVMLAVPEGADDAMVQTAVEREIEAVLEACRDVAGVVIIVSSEVGSGVVPASHLGRLFRDLLGRANQVVAAESQATYLMVAGLAVEVRALARSVEDAARAALVEFR